MLLIHRSHPRFFLLGLRKNSNRTTPDSFSPAAKLAPAVVLTAVALGVGYLKIGDHKGDTSVSNEVARAREPLHPYLRRPSFHFDVCKKYYPMYTAGRGRNGEIVYYEECGKIDNDALLRNGVTLPILIEHYVMTTMATFEVIDPTPNLRMITIFDVKGVTMGFLKGGPLEFLQEASKIMQMEYSEKYDYRFAERNSVVCFVNVPDWASYGWRVIRKLLKRSTIEKSIILSESETYKGLLKYLDHNNIPKRYGGGMGGLGKGDCRFTSADELKLREFVMGRNNNLEFQVRPD